mgnify:CR=1 FL=1
MLMKALRIKGFQTESFSQMRVRSNKQVSDSLGVDQRYIQGGNRMNLINKEVTHEKFGKGSIVEHDDSIVEIRFTSERKKFVFPDAFGKYIKLHDRSAVPALKKLIQQKELEQAKKERKKLLELKKRRREEQLRIEHEKLMKNHKLHPKSQMVYWCDAEEQNKIFTEWRVFTGTVRSGTNKGSPKKLTRLYPNSVCLLTARESNNREKDRRIIGAFMVQENFVGKLREDGYVPAHSKYRIQLTDEEAENMPFWKYYMNEKSPNKTTWNSGKYRYFDNELMAQILFDIVSMKRDTEENELAQDFFDHFCKMNKINEDELTEPNGALMQK